jgi:putative transcriptional regulator
MKNRVKVLRAEHNLTQADLAKAVEVSRQTINAIEKGKFDPSLILAFKLSEYFSTKIEDMFEYQG